MRNLFPSINAQAEIINGDVHYYIDHKKTIFPIDQIQLIGEFTTVPDSFDTQYFFAFKVAGYNEFIEIPAYTDGIFDVIQDLKSHIPGLGNPKLQMVTGFDSNILFPVEYAGEKLFSFSSESKPIINFPILRKLARIEKVNKNLNPNIKLPETLAELHQDN